MTLSRFGKRFDDTVKKAMSGPQQPPKFSADGDLHNEGDQWWKRTAGAWFPFNPTEQEKLSWAVSQEAERLQSFDQIAASFQKTLTKLLNQRGWPSVSVEYEATTDWYHIVARRRSMIGLTDKVQHNVPEEELARHTTSQEAFLRFAESVCDRLIGKKVNLKDEYGDGWYEAGGNVRGPLSDLTMRQISNPPPFMWEDEPDLEREEQAAIDSIKRTLDERSES